VSLRELLGDRVKVVVEQVGYTSGVRAADLRPRI
jgi:hypothetical protein